MYKRQGQHHAPLGVGADDLDGLAVADVITASNGKTIEIISTDAEGRMVLADALVDVYKRQV